MRKTLIVTVSLILLLAAFAPWVAAAFQTTTLVPLRLQQANQDYYAELELKQQEVQATMRASESQVKVIVVGSVPERPAPSSVTIATATPLSPTPMLSQTVEVRTLVVTSTASTPTPFATVAPVEQSDVGAESSIPLPAGLVDMEDTLTRAALTSEINRAPGAEIFTELQTILTDEGFRVTGSAEMIAGLQQEAEVIGRFEIVNYSLVSQVAKVTVGGTDVTDRYQSDLQQRIDTVLYQLLPQRFVTSFVIDNEDTMRVQSQIRP